MSFYNTYIWPFWLRRWAASTAGVEFWGSDSYCDNYLFGSSGNDTIHGGGSCYTEIYGFGGNDQLWAGNRGRSVMYGGDGNDWVQGHDGGDYLSGDRGNDTIYGMGGHDDIRDTSGNNLISGNDGDDTIYTRDGRQAVWGDSGDDRITADNAQAGSTFRGGGGRDTIKVNGRDIIIHGDESDDFIEYRSHSRGWDGTEIHGDAGDDTIVIRGGGFVDIEGGLGADVIDFGHGFNITAHYHSIAHSPRGRSDVIRNFGKNHMHRIDIDAMVPNLEWRWARDRNDTGVGAVWFHNGWTNSKFYAYGPNNAVLELTFVASAHLEKEHFII